MTDQDPVVLDTYPSPFIAEMLVGLLTGEGVRAFVEGASLTDEFATSQRAMGNLSVRVFVAPDQLDRAREIIATARAAGALAADAEGEDSTSDETPNE